LAIKSLAIAGSTKSDVSSDFLVLVASAVESFLGVVELAFSSVSLFFSAVFSDFLLLLLLFPLLLMLLTLFRFLFSLDVDDDFCG